MIGNRLSMILEFLGQMQTSPRSPPQSCGFLCYLCIFEWLPGVIPFRSLLNTWLGTQEALKCFCDFFKQRNVEEFGTGRSY